MNFLQMGSVTQYARNLAQKTQWKLKKQNADFRSRGKSLRDYVSLSGRSGLTPEEEERDDRLSAILSKAQAGKKLSPEEWEYLREKSPQMYQKLQALEQEAEAYEKALRHCKTREEAQRLHVSKLGEIMTAAKAAFDVSERD